jgi:Tol biopolymer transport system component
MARKKGGPETHRLILERVSFPQGAGDIPSAEDWVFSVGLLWTVEMDSRSCLLVAVTLFCSSCREVVEPPSQPERPVTPVVPSTHPIIFSSQRDSTYGAGGHRNREILAARLDGSDFVNLSRNPADDFNPSWSPDGKWVAFTSSRDGSTDIFVMRDDGTAVRKLLVDPLHEDHASWSPDGKKIIFESQRDGGASCANCFFRNYDIFIADADGSHVRNLTATPLETEAAATWSPDGKTIAFSGRDSQGLGIFLINSDGTSRRRLPTTLPDLSPDVAAWSPDGSRLAVSALNTNRAGLPPIAPDLWVIFTIKPDGTDQRLVTPAMDHARFPSWSPDGSQIVYTIDSFPQEEGWGFFRDLDLMIMNADGSGKKALTNDPGKMNQIGSAQAWRK